jgi:hypothetical protein
MKKHTDEHGRSAPARSKVAKSMRGEPKPTSPKRHAGGLPANEFKVSGKKAAGVKAPRGRRMKAGAGRKALASLGL